MLCFLREEEEVESQKEKKSKEESQRKNLEGNKKCWRYRGQV